jgi:predicted Zn-dependent protease
MEEEFAKQMYQQVLRQFGNKVLPTYHPDSRLVQRVLNRLIPASGLTDEKWEVHVINDPKQVNAFVVPG